MLDSLFLAFRPDTSYVREISDGAAILKALRAVEPRMTVEYLCLNLRVPTDSDQFVSCYFSDTRAAHFVTPAQLRINDITWPGAGSESLLAQGRCVHRLPDPDAAIDSGPIQIPSVHGETTLFLASAPPDADMSDSDWPMLPDTACLGQIFHQYVLKAYGCGTHPDATISQRELDCLKWIAHGKTAWEASVILGITERTVRFHLNSAREKLNCTTTTQAVAQVVARQLIAI